MVVQPHALCSRLFKNTCRLSVSKVFSPALRRRGFASRVSSSFRRDTILEDVNQGPACTCWSILSPSSSLITSNISSLKIRKAKIKSGKTPLVVLLVTSAHVRLLDDGNTFIPSIIQLAIENTWTWQKFDLLAAVVDGIPQARTYRSRLSHAADLVPSSSPQTRQKDGSEGVSVAILESETATPTLWSPREMPSERERVTAQHQQRCTLSFSFPSSPGIRTQFSERSASQPLVERMLQVPVANTIFQNGRASTLFAQKWELKFRGQSIPEYISGQKTWLPQQTVDMGAIFANECMRLRLHHLVHSYLVPVTPARTVTAAVGNIVCKISRDNSSAKNAPASEELEEAISNAIQQSQIPAQQAAVWALVRPERYAALDRAAQSTIRDVIEYAVLTGARLHKVLSGGGGWGTKHGLLALDPDPDYDHQHQAFESYFGNDQDAETESRKGLGEIVKPGDSITFYVYRSPSDADTAEIRTSMFPNRSQSTAATLSFGSLPSNMDTMRELGTVEAEVHTPSELTLETNHFGMLSEQGMSLKSSFLNTNITANRIQYLMPELDKQVFEVRHGRTVTTKLDAPYTLLSIRGQASRIPVSSEVREDELQAFNVHLQQLMPSDPSMAAARAEPAASFVQKLFGVDDQIQENQSKAARLRIVKVVGKEKFLLDRPGKSGKSDEVVWKRITETLVSKRGDYLTSPITFMSQVQEAQEPRDASSGTIPRYFSFRPSDFYQTHSAPPKQQLDTGAERLTRSSPDDVNCEKKLDSVLILREESEGKDPGLPSKGREGNIFMIRKHVTRNPYERLQDIKRVGEITSREQAMGLHSQYHLALEKQLREVQKP